MPRRIASELAATFELFVLKYLANGMNAAAAYRAAHPRASQRTAETQGSEYLKRPEVQRLLELHRKERRQRLQMEADEAIERLTRIGRADIRNFFKNGRVIPIEQIPDAEADAVKSIKLAADGTITIQLYDKLRALEMLAIDAGRIRPQRNHKDAFDLVDYLGAQPPRGDDE